MIVSQLTIDHCPKNDQRKNSKRQNITTLLQLTFTIGGQCEIT